MKKVLIAIGAFIVLACIGQYAMTAHATGLYPPALGGTGTGVVPSSGQVLIGNGAGTYTPALITPGTDIIITNASGSVTLAVKASDFLPSSTVYVATVNGQSGTVAITSSTLSVATNTLSLFNGNGFTTTTIQAVLNALSAVGLATYNSSTGQFSVSSSSLNLKSASQYNFSDFLPSSTVYVATVNGQSGAVTIGVPATTTLNGTQATVFKVIGDGTTVTSTVNGTTTTFSIINTGNWAGTWQGANSSTFYLATNPLGFTAVATTSINGTQAQAFSIVSGNGITTTVSGATTTITLNIGSGCSGGNFVQTVSPTGTITCATPSGGASSTNVYGTNGVTVTQAGVNATASLNTAYGATWTALQTFNTGASIYGTTTLASTTNALLTVNGSGVVSAYGGSNPCTSGQAAVSISATGVISCLNVVTSTVGNWAGTWQGVNSSTLYLASNPNNYISSSTGNGLYLQILDNLSDLNSTSSARTNLGYSGLAPISISATGTVIFTNPGYITTSSISINGVSGNVFTGLATSTGILSYNVSSANSYIGVSTTTTSAVLTFSTSSFGSNAFNSTAFLTGNQTITLSGAVSGSGATAISTSYNTSTLYGLFSGALPLGFNTSTGQFTFTNPGYASSSITVTGGGILSGGGALTGNEVISLTTSTLNTQVSALGYVTSTSGLASYNVTSANSYITVSTTTTSAALTFVTSSFGSAAFQASTQFLASSTVVNTPSTTIPTVYVSTFNGATGTVTGVGSLSNNAAAGGVNFSAATGSGITAILNSLALSQFTGNIVNTVNGATGTVSITSSSLGVVYNPNWITTSTYNASITIATAIPLGGGGQLSNGGTLSLTCTGCLTAALQTLQGLSTSSIALATSGPLISSIVGSGNVITFTTVPTSTILAGYATSSSAAAGSYTNANITVNANGIVTVAANGSGGSGSGVPSTTPWSANYIPVVSSSLSIANSSIYNATSGNIGIGTTTPSSALVITNASGTSQTSFDDSTTSPNYYLQVEASSGTQIFTIASTTQSTFAGPLSQSGGNVALATTTVSTNLQTQTLNEPVVTSTATGAATTINWALSSIQALQLQTTTALSFTNCTNGQKPTLYLYQDGTGSRTVTWPSSGSCQVAWLNGEGAPSLPTAASTDFPVSFQCADTYFVTSTIVCRGQYVSSTPSMYYSN